MRVCVCASYGLTALLVLAEAHDVHGLSRVLVLVGIVHSRDGQVAVAQEGVGSGVLKDELLCRTGRDKMGQDGGGGGGGGG